MRKRLKIVLKVMFTQHEISPTNYASNLPQQTNFYGWSVSHEKNFSTVDFLPDFLNSFERALIEAERSQHLHCHSAKREEVNVKLA